MEEIEVKFLNIIPDAIERRLKKIGAQKVFDRLYRRRIFDYPDLRLDQSGAWIRLRDEGDKITLAFKRRIGRKSDDGSQNDQTMEEIEIEVGDFDETAKLLLGIGLKEKYYQESRRIRYFLEGDTLDIDFWPGLSPYLEIEASGWEKIDEIIKKLGLNPDQKKIFSATQIYNQAGINEKEYRIMTLEKMVKRGGKHE